MPKNTIKKDISYYIGLNVVCVVGLLMSPVFIGVAGPLRFFRGCLDLLIEAVNLPKNAIDKYNSEYAKKYMENDQNIQKDVWKN